ncbi:glycine/betaine ABC transporter substrate-binding protein [Anaerosporomusa subterranea]|uniref:Glycine/betaine ABC transporter substrate-binding protein n=1 Tax=Anaerosporomusa subterranea TaxID=1794912 RepID=A0A154BM73_ANASB|nr:glycine betaine ABC transporter substrate-binding protein [Anaerosporomusa subterranea]KYZ75016.1 glycine/betaine ABC transporter substrate-binding protein [Anaerosporomusa subterranea]MDF2500394.1 ABC-type glycine betaine transport, periplasmic subunit [Anaerosporomusa subterranea]
MKKKLLVCILIMTMALVFAGCSSSDKNSGKVVIGGKNFTEQDILVYLMKYTIEEKTELTAEVKPFLGGTNIVAQALDRGDVDIYAEYTGTGLMNILGQPLVSDPQAAYDKVKAMYKEQKKIIWLEPFGFNNTYTITMRTDVADSLGISKVSDLVGKASELSFGCTHEFLERPDGLNGLQEKYGIQFKQVSGMDPGLTYAAVRDKKVDLIDGFATDGRIPAFNLKVLEDDKQFFPPYFAAPIVREDTLKKHPEIADALKLLAGKIDDKEMAALNAKVDLEKKDAKEVAKTWLKEKGIIK